MEELLDKWIEDQIICHADNKWVASGVLLHLRALFMHTCLLAMPVATAA